MYESAIPRCIRRTKMFSDGRYLKYERVPLRDTSAARVKSFLSRKKKTPAALRRKLLTYPNGLIKYSSGAVANKSRTCRSRVGARARITRCYSLGKYPTECSRASRAFLA